MNTKQFYTCILVISALSSNRSFSQDSNLEIITSFGVSLTGDANTNETLSEVWPLGANKVPNDAVESPPFKYATPTITGAVAINKFFKGFPLGISVKGNLFSFRRNTDKLLNDSLEEYDRPSESISDNTSFYAALGIGPVVRFKIKSEIELSSSLMLLSTKGSYIKPSFSYSYRDGTRYGWQEFILQDKGRSLVMDAVVKKTFNEKYFFILSFEYYRLKSTFRYERILDKKPEYSIGSCGGQICKGTAHGTAADQKEVLVGISLNVGVGIKIKP